MAKKEYTKIHKSEKAANDHARKIKQGGGKVIKEKVGTTYRLTYSY